MNSNTLTQSLWHFSDLELAWKGYQTSWYPIDKQCLEMKFQQILQKNYQKSFATVHLLFLDSSSSLDIVQCVIFPRKT